MRIRKSNKWGFTMIEIMIVVALVGLLATIATPTWVRARTASQSKTCINNLRQIDGAKNQWALETKQAPDITPDFTDISGYLRSSVTCPAGGNNNTFANSYTMNSVSTKPVCNWVPQDHFIPETTQ